MIKHPYDPTDSTSILLYAQTILGKSLFDMLHHHAIEAVIESEAYKGQFGILVEKFFFGITPGNAAAPDFIEAGVELKTTPLRKRGSSFVAKERLVFGMIDFRQVVYETWENSSFLKKNGRVLLMAYLYEKKKPKVEYVFKMVQMLDFLNGLPAKDLQVIRKDWELIVDKVRQGKAHELSEGDTFYLGACTKGQTANDRATQPFSPEKAMRRAFSLKPSYLNAIIKGYFRQVDEDKQSVLEGAPAKTIEDVVYERLGRYIGMTTGQIHDSLDLALDKKAKSYYAALARRMLGIHKKGVEEFDKSEVSMKTIRLQSSGLPRESMSFPAIDYQSIIKEEWPTSSFRELLSSKKYLFIVYQFTTDGELVFRGGLFWNIPYGDLEGDIKKVWTETVKRMKNGQADRLPRMSYNPVCHVRPHGRDSADTMLTHYGEEVVKQSFWLNARYIGEQVKSLTF